MTKTYADDLARITVNLDLVRFVYAQYPELFEHCGSTVLQGDIPVVRTYGFNMKPEEMRELASRHQEANWTRVYSGYHNRIHWVGHVAGVQFVLEDIEKVEAPRFKAIVEFSKTLQPS